MLKMKSTVCIEASQEKCWRVLADVENLSQWSEAVISAKCSGDIRQGLGMERTCDLVNNITITEVWTAWQEGESYTYIGFGLPLVKSAQNTWSLREVEGKTYLTTESEVVLKGGFLGRLLEPLMRWMSNKMGADALAALKYLIENDQPYPDKHSKLPRPMATC